MKIQYMVLGVLILLASGMACNAEIMNIVVAQQEHCPDGVPVEKAEVYAGEVFYVCGEVQLNGNPLTSGTISAVENNIMNDRAAIINNGFSLRGNALVDKHRYYYIIPSLEVPCQKEFEAIPIEIKTECLFVSPSSIEALPDVVTHGEVFDLHIKNAPSDIRMELYGLETPLITFIEKGGEWSQEIQVDECIGTGDCTINLKFTDIRHELCTATASVVVSVRMSEEDFIKSENSSVATGVMFLVLVLGTAGAIIIGRHL